MRGVTNQLTQAAASHPRSATLCRKCRIKSLGDNPAERTREGKKKDIKKKQRENHRSGGAAPMGPSPTEINL